MLFINFDEVLRQTSLMNNIYYKKRIEKVTYQDVLSNFSKAFDTIDPVLANRNFFNFKY